MELDSLLEISSQIKDYGMQLHSIMSEIDSVTGLMYAVDSVFDQQVIDMGKLLPNEAARKRAKDVLRQEHDKYPQWAERLADLKQLKLSISYERESLKIELDIHVTDIKRETAKVEASTMATWLDQTNYLQAVEQDKFLSVTSNQFVSI